MTPSRSRRAAAVAALLALGVPGAAPAAQDTAAFARRDVMIPMRDGVRLYTRIFTPRDATGPLPVMFLRTPYGIDGSSSASIVRGYDFLARDGYVFVFQDIRGKFRSEGAFEMQRPPRRDRTSPTAIDEGTDAYDSIQWLIDSVPGVLPRVGMTGVSYGGWLTAMAMLDPHPALKAVSPQASPSDMWKGDDFHHNGAFRLSYGFEYATMMESGKDMRQFAFDTYDTYDWYLRLGSLAAVNQRVLKGTIPTWNDFAAHPDYDAFWQRQAMKGYLTRVTVPTLNVAGWWDQEDFYGPLTIYRELERHDAKGQNTLVVGPWNHGGWMRGDGASLGPIQFDQPTARFFRDSVMGPFFAHHLHGKAAPALPEALVFEAGSNQWRRYPAWPPKAGVTPRAYYLREEGQLATEPPRAADAARARDTFVSDPAKPVPYRARPIPATYDPRGSTWSTWLTDDQRFAHNRPDVLSYQTGPLEDEVTLAGEITVQLATATTGADADWVVKLIDVYPDTGVAPPRMNGYQLMVANDVFRARYRDGDTKPVPMVPGTIYPVTIDLHTMAYTFRKGHRIMVQVQGSWFPLIDRNPQTWVPNIFEAKPTDFRAASHSVVRSARHASRIVLPVVNRTAQ